MEIEAKFTIPDEDTGRRLLELPQLAGFPLGQVQVAHLHDRYLDTPDGALRAHGFACRLRRQDHRYQVTLKGLGGAEGGLHRRTEHEVDLPAPLDPRDWPAGAARDLVLEVCGDRPLRPLFDLRQVRHNRLVRDGERHVAQLSIDRVSLLRGESVIWAYLELETELLPGGTEQDLRRLMAELEHGWSLVPEHRSKFGRSMAFLESGAGSEQEGGKWMENRLTADERSALERLAHERDVIARRARALLAWDEGLPRSEVVRCSGLSPRRVRHWLHTFRQRRMAMFPPRVLAALPTSPGEPPPGTAAEAPPEEPGELAILATSAPAVIGPVEETSVPPVRVSLVEEQAPSPPRRPQLLKAPGIEPDDPMSEAGRKALRFHFRQMLYHEEGTRAGVDIEALHDMRVATRRMRAALSVFGDHYDPKAIAPHLKGLRRTGRALGAVRDLDVFREKIHAYIAGLPAAEQGSLNPFLEELQKQRETARASMVTFLDGSRYARFVEQLGLFVETEGVGSLRFQADDGEPRPYRVRHVAPMAIYERLAEVRAYDEWVTVPQPPLARLHALRIACKRLRYTLEFFAEVLRPGTGALIKQVVVVQDHLGEAQDAVVASGILRDFLVWGTWGPAAAKRRVPDQATPVIAPGVATYLATRQVEVQRLVGSFPQVWQRLNVVEFSQLVAEAVSVL